MSPQWRQLAPPHTMSVMLVVAFALTLLLALPMGAGAQFGVGLQTAPTPFHDPNGLFALDVPAGWSYQDELSEEDFFVFFGTGDYDLFYIEILDAPAAGSTAADQAQATVSRYAGPNGLSNFGLVSAPTPGRLADKEASFIVYTYTDGSGVNIAEGRAFVVHQGKVVTLAFADEADRFNNVAPTFNRVMESLRLYERADQGTLAPVGFGPIPSVPVADNASTTSASMGSSPVGGSPTGGSPTGSSQGEGSQVYTSPNGHFQFSPPPSWELWEEQSTARGDSIEPWHTLLNWPGRPITKTLFIWDFFDEWNQTGAQYDVVMAVIENVPGTLNQAVETLKNQMTGSQSHIYTPSTQRVRVGNQTGLAVQITTRPGMVEPWSEGPAWFKSFAFYVFKQGNSLFVWALPNDLIESPEVEAALQSLVWTGR